jgi:hypothetical protein
MATPASDCQHSNFNPSIARSWLSRCQRSHASCKRERPSDWLPSRVIDVLPSGNTDVVRLISARDMETRDYSALSYVWGGPQRVTTTTATLESHLRGLHVDALPKTLRDAIFVTRGLGFRYLWVDALCILQDSTADQKVELARMRHYYRSAVVVITASGAGNVEDGFLHEQKPQRAGTEQMSSGPKNRVLNVPFYSPEYDFGRLTIEEVYQEYNPDNEPIRNRGWTLQEGLLCPRNLIFPSTGGVIWQCYMAETVYGKVYYRKYNFRTQHNLHLLSEYIDAPSLERGFPRAEKLHSAWLGLVEDYSQRTLGVLDDKLVAIAGLAEEFDALWGKHIGTYLAGHWENYLVQSLCWWVSRDDPSQPRPKPKIYRAPSWSWAAVDGGVNWWPAGLDMGGHNPQIEIVDYSAELAFGAVKYGSLTVKGILKNVFWNVPEKNAKDLDLYDNANKQRYLGKGRPDTMDVYATGSRMADVLLLYTRSDRREQVEHDEVAGLVLEKVSNNVYCRIGIFQALYNPKEGDIRSFFDGCERRVISLI